MIETYGIAVQGGRPVFMWHNAWDPHLDDFVFLSWTSAETLGM